MPFNKALIVNRKLLIGKKNPNERTAMNNKQSFSAHKPAFTLIELLVVIAIIGILTTLITYSFTDSQKKSRDSRRKSDLESIRKALELAKQDSAGNYSYPSCRTAGNSCELTADDTTSSANGATNPDLNGTNYSYIKVVPQDPKANSGYTYLPTPATPCTPGTCTSFTLVACLENTKDPQKDETDTCTATDTVSYTISNL